MHKLIAPLALLAFGASSLAAQGTLSTQGFGYPPGELSTQAASLGGGIAETDPLSTVNPAAMASWLRSGLYFQYSPEYRNVSANGRSDRTMTSRFPLMQGALTIGDRAVVGLAWSTLLDRTWETQRSGTYSDGSPFTENFRTAGGIGDVRLGVAYGVLRSLWLGVGAHLFTGDDQIGIARTSPDTVNSIGFNQSSLLSFSGTGVSAGIAWQPVSAVTIGASGRIGGTIKSYQGDTLLQPRGKVPKRFGAGVTVTAAPGVLIAARANWDGWSSLRDLGHVRNPGDPALGIPPEAPLGVTDAWDVGGGVQLRGPTVFGAALPLRVGFRHRTLPFTVNGTDVRENTYSFGAAIPLVGGRSRIDLGLDRALRSAVQGVQERAWILSAGFMVRP